MTEQTKDDDAAGHAAKNVVTLCAWSNTVKHEGEWMPFSKYLERRFGLLATHGISPHAMEQLLADAPVWDGDALDDPRRLSALRATRLLDAPPSESFDRITRLGAAALNVPVAFISLVEGHRDFYLSQSGFREPLASARELQGETFCKFTVQQARPLVIPDTRADAVFAAVPTVESLGIAAYLGAPMVRASGEVIGAFCAIDYAPHVWTGKQVLAATDLAILAVSEIELRQAALEFQRQLD